MLKTHPLKILKYCPKCGSHEFEKSGDRSLKCASCNFHLFINASTAVAALIINKKKELMLVTRGVEPDYGKLDLPGGFIDPGESAENAIKRELKEELGIHVKSLQYIGSAPNEYVYSGFCVFTLDMAFVVIPESLEDLKPMDDILAYKFFSKDEIDYNEIPARSIKQFVKDYFHDKNK